MDSRFYARLAMVPLAIVALHSSTHSFDTQPTREYSLSLTQARRRGTLITEVEMVPSTLKWKGHEISLKSAWIEKCKTGGCYLCFHLKEGKDVFYPGSKDEGFFVLDDLNAGFRTHFGLGWTQMAQHLESEDFTKARLSLIGNWKDQRPKNIRFVRKQQPDKRKWYLW